MQFISIDPGKHVGIAQWDNEILCKSATMIGTTPDNTLLELGSLITEFSKFADYIVVEAFNIVSFRGQNLEAIEQIGLIKYLSRYYDIPYVLQQPSVRKPFESLTGPCRTLHERSAIAHGLYFLNKMKKEKWG